MDTTTFQDCRDADFVRLGGAANPVLAFSRFCRYNTVTASTASSKYLTTFHSVVEPNVSLPKYIERLCRHAEATETGVLLGLCLAGRYAAVTGTTLTTLCAHRLVLACMLVGVKAHMDQFRSNRTYARVGGVSLAELNELEVELLVALDHRVTVSKQELDAMCAAAGRAAGMSWVANAAHDAAACATKAFVIRHCAGLPPLSACTDTSASPSSPRSCASLPLLPPVLGHMASPPELNLGAASHSCELGASDSSYVPALGGLASPPNNVSPLAQSLALASLHVAGAASNAARVQGTARSAV